MRFLFSLALVGIPLLDIASLIAVGGVLGVWETVALAMLSGAIGVIMIRAQGFAILAQARDTLRKGGFPGRQVFDGACALVGGVLLILPGFVSDLIGSVLLIPPCRALLLGLIGRHVRRSGHFAVWDIHTPPPASPRQGGAIIEGEFQTLDPSPEPSADAPRRPSAEKSARTGRSPWRRQDAADVVPPGET